MIELDSCPVCNSKQLTVIKEMSGKIVEPPPNLTQASTNSLLKFVLKQESYQSQTKYCGQCTHVFNSPTFSEDELNLYYSPDRTSDTKKQIRASEQTSGKTWAEQNHIPQNQSQDRLIAGNKIRAERLLELVKPYTRKPIDEHFKICDVGGKNGELTSAFTKAKRFVHATNTGNQLVEHVTFLETMEDVKRESPMDLIIMSHILEHVPFPIPFIASFIPLLSPGGLFYAEIPLEYCVGLYKKKGFYLDGHVNFYTKRSILYTLQQAGFNHIHLAIREISPYGQLRIPVVKVLCSVQPQGRQVTNYPWPIEFGYDCYLTMRAKKVNQAGAG